MSSGARVLIAVVSLGVVLAGAAHAADATRIVGVRVGSHAEFDRLVIEVQGELQAYHQPVRSGEKFVLELNAEPAKPIEVLDTPFARMGRVRIEGIADGSLVQVQARPRNVRAFLLSEPTRVVIDFSSPQEDPLPIPEGAARLLEAVAPPWVEVEAEVTEPVAEPEPEIPEPVVEPEIPEPVAELEPEPPIALPEPGTPEPAPVGRTPSGSSAFFDRGLMLALGAATLAAVLVVVGARRIRRPPALEPEVAVAGPSETITPEELQRDDRLGALESRLDEEVRSRARVEDKLSQLHEDMKVVRDRLHRVSRRGPRDPGSGD